ncbi:Pyridoxal-phosphate dependent enzyme [Tenacibaculum sp. MAR_2010_89]|uniref:threonine synthase n=1 Tax=Tenacibaculum sp. MAR_2010_89 TaxID=1250198 RepID=UPI00089B5467|nr:threonine synthase [Tenacibaculum sp. MAR_2010_89]SEE09117.1 Pyridoxal-phosphate dependent enzyme [Tenacibaculum sp. MAR_2010_89]
MLQFVSNKGGGKPVDFETAILDGFALDGGLYVPEILPEIKEEQLKEWKDLSYVELAFEILSLFIDRSIISENELKGILQTAYAPFEKKEIIPLYKIKSRKDTYIMELFHGPTISFKDVGLAFLVNLVNFFLERKKEHLTIVVATTGDTGPATAYFAAGKSNIDAWVLYPKGLITEEQERQMTTLQQANVHPVGVSNCPDGGDDLDAVISKLYANKPFKEKLKLSSVNSINWGRVMMQTVHYFYGYLQVVDTVGEQVNMSVPSGGFGNLCAGGLARKMGLPIKYLVAANNKNACLHRIFSEGRFTKEEIIETPSSAIDILIPFNFWRYLYFCIDKDTERIKKWMDEFKTTGNVTFDKETFETYKKGFLSNSSSDQETLNLINEIYTAESYLLDPHGAVSLNATDVLKNVLGNEKLICLATAHPSKFPEVIKKALSISVLPKAGTHQSIENEKRLCEKVHLCNHEYLEEALIHAMETNWDLTKGK